MAIEACALIAVTWCCSVRPSVCVCHWNCLWTIYTTW